MTASLATVAYIGATILFILSLGGLSNPETARRGNLFGMIGMTIAVLATVLGPKVTSIVPIIIVTALNDMDSKLVAMGAGANDLERAPTEALLKAQFDLLTEVDAQHGEVVRGAGADQGGAMVAAVGQPYPGLGGTADDVEIGDDVTGFIPDEPRTGAARYGEHIAGPEILYLLAGGDVGHRAARALEQGNGGRLLAAECASGHYRPRLRHAAPPVGKLDGKPGTERQRCAEDGGEKSGEKGGEAGTADARHRSALNRRRDQRFATARAGDRVLRAGRRPGPPVRERRRNRAPGCGCDAGGADRCR